VPEVVDVHDRAPEQLMSENRLGAETSPYLLQHKDNPVHWRAWGPEALAEAKDAGKPILLSVGYAACHWCHVMAHESFEDEPTAAVMNELFVNIKVDREERPDIDAIYMGALHRLGQQGGWPLTMFLDSEARPFWGGTYFPKTSRWGRPAFVDVLRQVASVFHTEPEKVAKNATAIIGSLSRQQGANAGVEFGDTLLKDLTQRMVRAVDPVHGGINGAPKFPQWGFFWLLWRGAVRYAHEPARTAVVTTLQNICQGGIYDHLGGGFARYSVDERWLAPHFEKMLYDNALLVDLLTEVWRETQDPLFKVRIFETVDWLLREMIAEGGGFAASYDADSEGEEGKFYVWTAREIEELLGPEDAAFFAKVYDVAPEGNWEGHTILNRLGSMGVLSDEDEHRLAAMRTKLVKARDARVHPGWDDKVLADWNGLMIAALARASQVFERPDWLAAAERAFAFVATSMTATGRLLHAYRKGRAAAPATASDYANMIWAALRLYQATARDTYLAAARRWTDVLDRHYWMADPGGYAMSADDTADVIVRLRSAADDATPNANAVMVSNLAALAVLTGETAFADRADATLRSFSGEIAQSLVGHTGLLAGAMDLIAPQIVILVNAGNGAADELSAVLRRHSLPGALEFTLGGATIQLQAPALAGKSAIGDKTTAYLCTGPQCSAPVCDVVALEAALKRHQIGI
jgi:uncharacterized protein YyaL (SSP411 family)